MNDENDNGMITIVQNMNKNFKRVYFVQLFCLMLFLYDIFCNSYVDKSCFSIVIELFVTYAKELASVLKGCLSN